MGQFNSYFLSVLIFELLWYSQGGEAKRHRTRHLTQNQQHQHQNIPLNDHFPSLSTSKINKVSRLLVIPYGGSTSKTNDRKRKSSSGGIVEPVTLVAVKEVKHLQNEVLRLRRLLDDNRILHAANTINDLEDETEFTDGNRKTAQEVPLIDEDIVQVDKETQIVKVCTHVSDVLNNRLKQITNKKRSKWFAKQYKKKEDSIDGQYAIISGHGREDESQKQQVQKIEPTSLFPEPIVIDEFKQPTLYFPGDILSLDMVFTQDVFTMASDEIQAKQLRETHDHHSMYETEKLFLPKLLIRAIQLGINFTPVTITALYAAMSTAFRENVWYGLVGRCLAKSGPAFIKWGQWASTRSDMFPDALCLALSELHADAPSHSWKVTQETVEEALCIPKGCLFEVFQEFDENPVASGSIAQVHRAKLQPFCDNIIKNHSNYNNNHNEGSVVAVKVRHPNVSRLIDMDFRLMAMMADVIDRFSSLSWLRIRDSVEQFSHTMAAQAHLNVEAHHLEVLNYNFRKWDEVNFPIPLFACASVIIETFEKGEICTSIIDKYDALVDTKYHNDQPIVEEEGNDEQQHASRTDILYGYELMPIRLSKFIVTTGLSLYLKMLLVDNLMHADLHPGNIMLECQIFGEKYGDISPLASLVDVPVGGASIEKIPKYMKKNFYGHVTLVDAGMVAQLDDDESTNFIGLISALGEGDGRAAAKAIMRFNSKKSSEDEGFLTHEQREAFIKDVITYFEDRCKGYGTNVDFGEVLRGILGIVKEHRIQFGANYATLVVNALCLDGLAKRVCPTYNLLDASKPLLRAHRSIVRDDDEGFLSSRPVVKKALIRAATPILYFRKRQNDNNFFKNLELQRQGKLVIHSTSAAVRGNNPMKQWMNKMTCIGNLAVRIYKNQLHSRVVSVGTLAFVLHHTLSTVLSSSTMSDTNDTKDTLINSSSIGDC